MQTFDLGFSFELFIWSFIWAFHLGFASGLFIEFLFGLFT